MTGSIDPADAPPGGALILDAESRQRVWAHAGLLAERYAATVDAGPVAPAVDVAALRATLARFTFDTPLAPAAALDAAAAGLTTQQVHVAHARYFGLFNPAPSTMGIAGDALASAFNAQLAAWSHNPFAVEVERHLVRAFAGRLGCDTARVEGTFTAGGMEANHSALLVALAVAFPEWSAGGVRALPRAPVLYVSSESHHSIVKAVRLAGLGTDAVVAIPTDAAWRMDPAALETRIREDGIAGRAPFLVVATAGTTSAGVVDPIGAIAHVVERAGLWLHVDAAWGGAAALSDTLRPLLAGIERADSITLDCHKWLSVPMTAGLMLTRHAGALARAFSTHAGYMPPAAEAEGGVDPYATSMQWSRRFIGLKVFLTLAAAGWAGYAATIDHQSAMALRLAAGLAARGWRVVNDPAMLVVCAVDGTRPDGDGADFLDAVAAHVVASGAAWISTTRLGVTARPVLRMCITNVRTAASDIDALLDALDRARAEVMQPDRMPLAPAHRQA